uniref:Uncharacterized protein n=1 Tax=Tanacetum cinerariifolium TaxID=118510 RepID=A0A6L2LWF3_TANCI|nr:hypothetical protein [Tanacetum cinerariifolium]
MGRRVGRGDGRGRGPMGGNDDYVDELNGQGNDQEVRANIGVEGVNGCSNTQPSSIPDVSQYTTKSFGPSRRVRTVSRLTLSVPHAPPES